MTAQHTPGPWFVGAQNDALFVIAGREPSINNDYPWHEAPRVALAKMYGPSDDDCLPVDADANARLIAASPDLLEALREMVYAATHLSAMDPTGAHDCTISGDTLAKARAAIAKAVA